MDGKREVFGFISMGLAVVPTAIFMALLPTRGTPRLLEIFALLYVFQIGGLVTGFIGIRTWPGKAGVIISIIIILGITYWIISIITGLPRT